MPKIPKGVIQVVTPIKLTLLRQFLRTPEKSACKETLIRGRIPRSPLVPSTLRKLIPRLFFATILDSGYAQLLPIPSAPL